MKIRIGLLLLAGVLALAGCGGGGHGRNINDPSNSLVFGYVDMAEAPTKVTGAQIRQVAPPTDKPYWGTDVKDGMFYTYYLPPAPTSWPRCTARASCAASTSTTPGRQGGGDTAVRIDKPGIYFLGAYKYKTVKTGMFEQSEVRHRARSTPSEAELLQKLLESDAELKNSVWADKIRQRIARLKK
jgi:hypothetical protein